MTLLSLLLLASCEDPIDATTQWRINNESSFNEYASKEDYTKASLPGSSAYVYMKWLTHGEGKEYSSLEPYSLKELSLLIRH